MIEWRKIENYPNYEVSNLGNVRNIKSNKMLKNQKTNNGYYIVQLSSGGKRKTFGVHQLVYYAFTGRLSNKEFVVDHINHNRTDNRFSNLRMITARENTNKKHLKSSSKYVGVCWYPITGKWKVHITVKGVVKHLGYFDNEYDAHLRYQKELNKINKL